MLLFKARIWAIACGRKDLQEGDKTLHVTYHICEVHFETRIFLNDLPNGLHLNAVPTIFPTVEGEFRQPSDYSYCLFNNPFVEKLRNILYKVSKYSKTKKLK